MLHLHFIGKSQPFAKIYPLFSSRHKWHLNIWKINHICPSICREWQGKRCVDRDCVRNVLDTNNIVCINFTTVKYVIVIIVSLNFSLKVFSFNPFFILISIDKIFIINGSLINIVVIVIIIIILYMCKILILSIWNYNL